MEIPASLTMSEIKYERDKLPHIIFLQKITGKLPRESSGFTKFDASSC